MPDTATKLVDADTHVSENEQMWEHFEREMYHRRPVLISLPENTLYGDRNAMWLIDGNIFPKPAGKGGFALITPSAAKKQQTRTDISAGCREITDPEARLRDMDKSGFDVQVIYPTLFLIYLTDDVALEVALCRAYNRWMAEACAKGQDRLKWVVIPPLAPSKNRSKNCAGQKNMARWAFSSAVSRARARWTIRYFFPVYQEASDLDLPICVHQGSGCPTFINFFDLERNRQWSHSAILPLFAFNDIVNNRIPEKFPKLSIWLHRSLRNLGAVSFALVQTAIPRAMEIFFHPRSVSRVSHFYRLRNQRESPGHRRLHRRGQLGDRFGLRPQRSLRATQPAADAQIADQHTGARCR